MSDYITLSEYFEYTRPSVKILVNLYSAIIRCIEEGEADYALFHMEYIQYDPSLGKFRFAVTKSAGDVNYKIMRFFEDIIRALKYAGEPEKKFAEEFRELYDKKGCVACKNLLEEYKKRIGRSHKVVTMYNAIYVCILILITVSYYSVYGIRFFTD